MRTLSAWHPGSGARGWYSRQKDSIFAHLSMGGRPFKGRGVGFGFGEPPPPSRRPTRDAREERGRFCAHTAQYSQREGPNPSTKAVSAPHPRPSGADIRAPGPLVGTGRAHAAWMSTGDEARPPPVPAQPTQGWGAGSGWAGASGARRSAPSCSARGAGAGLGPVSAGARGSASGPSTSILRPPSTRPRGGLAAGTRGAGSATAS